MPELLTKLAIQGKVELLLASLDRDTGLEKHAVQQARLTSALWDCDRHRAALRPTPRWRLTGWKAKLAVD